MKVEQVKTKILVPYARNAKLHSEEQITRIAKSIKDFGFNNPVLIDSSDGIIAGHGRVLAAKELGLKEVPCIRLKHLTDVQKRAYIIADNRLGEIGGGWDLAILEKELKLLEKNDIPMVDLGWDLPVIEEMKTEMKTKEAVPPEDFKEVGEDIETEHQCPKCGYKWSGGNGQAQ